MEDPVNTALNGSILSPAELVVKGAGGHHYHGERDVNQVHARWCPDGNRSIAPR